MPLILDIELLFLSKISCTKEILSLLQNFSIYPSKDVSPQFEKNKKFISKALIPCWNNFSYFYALNLLNPNIVHLNLDDGDTLYDIMQYVLLNCFGENLLNSTPIVSLVIFIYY